MRYFIVSAAMLSLTACSPSSDNTANTGMASIVTSETDVAMMPSAAGQWLPYYTDGSHALDMVTVGVMKLLPGQEAHAPHRHVEEEYLMVTRGSGEWYLNGERFAAAQGDMIFARSWDYHGVQAGNDGLEFVVFKYMTSDAAPTDPDPSLPELITE